jgi:RecJ-like exonuclease
MADVICPKCRTKGTVKVRQSRTEKGKDLKYYECTTCESLWTNTIEIADLSVDEKTR